MYQALYRKYRPRTFDDVAGQEHITETLKKQVVSGRLSHAYLFIGTRGTGKTSCAKILAKAVNCAHPVNGNPCNICPACRGIDGGSVRALRDEAVFSPASVRKRVYIIDEVHMLSTSAFNALLKILAEPPEHLMFILATTELRKVPATVLSRCQRHSFRRLDAAVISERLDDVAAREGLTLTHDASILLARLAEGSMRDGLSLLDQCSGADPIDSEAVLSAMGLAGTRRTAELLKAVSDGDSLAALTIFDELWRQGKDPAALLSDLGVLMRDLLIVSVAPKGGMHLISGAADMETLQRFSGRFTNAELLRAMQRTQEALGALRDNPSPRAAVELCLVSLCDPSLGGGLPELLARVSRLEEKGVCAAPAAFPAEGPEAACTPATSSMQKPEFEPGFAQEPGFPPMPESEPEDVSEGGSQPGPQRSDGDSAPAEDIDPAKAEAEPPSGGGAPAESASWEALVSAMKPRLAVGIYSLLTDPLQIMGVFSGDRLTLHIAKGFACDMLNKQDILAQFRECASGLTGRPIFVDVSEMDSGEKLATRSLKELERFKQVKFI